MLGEHYSSAGKAECSVVCWLPDNQLLMEQIQMYGANHVPHIPIVLFTVKSIDHRYGSAVLTEISSVPPTGARLTQCSRPSVNRQQPHICFTTTTSSSFEHPDQIVGTRYRCECSSSSSPTLVDHESSRPTSAMGLCIVPSNPRDCRRPSLLTC